MNKTTMMRKRKAPKMELKKDLKMVRKALLGRGEILLCPRGSAIASRNEMKIVEICNIFFLTDKVSRGGVP